MNQIKMDVARSQIRANKAIASLAEVNWEQRRYEIAKEVLPVLAEINERKDKPDLECWVARCAVDYADALIAELKKEVKP